MTVNHTCKTCIHWLISSDKGRYFELAFPYDPVTFHQEKTEEANAKKWGYLVRYCQHPRLEFYQRPARDAFSVVDGSQYYAALLTGEDFGCLLHETTSHETTSEN